MSKLQIFSDFDEKTARQEVDDYEFACHTIVVMKNLISFNFHGTSEAGPKNAHLF